ncbi:MAG: DUF86 domain-containing protein [Crocosphaera sp.]|nr:DUF86 domain-containing protein [Crocosphaera sp.]
MRSDEERLIDIQQAILKIEKYVVKGKIIFMENELIQTWILYNLQIIGEAVRSLSKSFKDSHNEIEWNDIADFRNVLVHEYFRVDLDLIWQIVEREIPSFKSQINLLLEEIEK